MGTTDALRLLATSAACAAVVSLSGCGGADQSAPCTVDEDALAERIADRVYERLQEQGHLEEGAGAAARAARAPSSGGEHVRTADDGGGAITPRNIVDALRRGLQGAPSEGEGEP